jgi:hypothetical protein
MLNYKICRDCINDTAKQKRSFRRFVREDYIRWHKNGSVACTKGGYAKVKKLPPPRCPFSLEHIMIEQPDVE